MLHGHNCYYIISKRVVIDKLTQAHVEKHCLIKSEKIETLLFPPIPFLFSLS